MSIYKTIKLGTVRGYGIELDIQAWNPIGFISLGLEWIFIQDYPIIAVSILFGFGQVGIEISKRD